MIVHDFFPATVKVAGFRHVTARVAIDGQNRGVVLTSSASGRGPIQTVAKGTVVSVTRDAGRLRTWTITLDDGSTWEAKVGGGCGCGNPLRRYDAEPAIQAAFAEVDA